MTDHMRKMIKEIMAQAALDGETNEKMSYDHPSVCRSFLEGFCINELFVNTKLDSGECAKVHSTRLRDEYERDKPAGRRVAAIEAELEQQLLTYVTDCDRKIQAAQRRMTAEPNPAKALKLSQELAKLEAEIDALTAESERLGQEGEIDRALELMTRIDHLKVQKTDKEAEIRTLTAHDSSATARARICEVCAAQLSASDEDKRIADHFTGKTHVGFQRLRSLLADLQTRKGTRLKRRRSPPRHSPKRVDAEKEEGEI